MTTDVRTLLHDAADAPLRQADIVGARQTARTRRRRRRGLAGALAAAIVAVATIGVARAVDDRGSSTRVAIGPRQSTEVPEGWTPVELDSGIQLALPPRWGVYDFGKTDVAQKRVSVGTSLLSDDGVITTCVPAVPPQAGTWLALWEYPDPTAIELPAPGGGDIIGLQDRPADFRSATPIGACAGTSATTPEGDFGAAFELFAFRDAGRLFVARVVTAYPTGATADFTQANEVLNTLRILPLPPATTAVPTTPSPTTVIAPTTAAPFVPSTADEQAIRDLFVSWQNGSNTDDDIRAIVEDADALLEFIHQGMAQHSAEDLAKYSGQVDAVRMIDAQHASVDYTLLWNGTPQFGRRTGTAVRIDGVWKVSRDTECALLALGNITCPPRSSP